mgnify:CR=1 FL=1
MYCTQCGTKLPDDTKVCPNCNTSFVPEEEVKAAVPEVQAAPQQEIPQETPQNIPPQMEAQAPQQPQFEQPRMMNGGFDPMTGQPLNGAPAAPQQPKEKKPLLKNKLFLGLMAGGAVLLGNSPQYAEKLRALGFDKEYLLGFLCCYLFFLHF